MTAELFVGLDLGQVGDPTALSAVDIFRPPAPNWVPPTQWWGRHRPQPPAPPPPIVRLRFLERLPLKTSYPDIVRHVVSRMNSPELKDRAELVVDATGVGRPVVDLFREAGLRPIPVTITSSTQVSMVGQELRVPKRDLIHALQVLLAQGRFRYSKQIKLIGAFLSEAQDFRFKIDKLTAYDSYAARDGKHDDIILSVALAVWRALGLMPATVDRPKIRGKGRRMVVADLRPQDTREWYESGDRV